MLLLSEQEAVNASCKLTQQLCALGSRGAEFVRLKPAETSRKGILGERDGKASALEVGWR